MPRYSYVLSALLLLALPGWSQQQDTHSIPPTRFSVFAGYSMVSPNFVNYDHSAENGYSIGAELGIANNAAGVAEFSQYFYDYGQGLTSPFVIVFGPRFWLPLRQDRKMRPFGDVLVGLANIQASQFGTPFQSSRGLALNAGGGVDVRTSGHTWFRGKAGYMYTGFPTDRGAGQVGPSRLQIVLGILYRR